MTGIRRWRVAANRDYAIFLLTALVVYILIFVGLYPIFQSRVWTVSLLPVTFVAWRYGRRSGVMIGLLVFILSLYLLYWFDPTGFVSLLIRSGVGGLALLELLGFLVGSLRDVATQAKLEITQRGQVEERFRVLSESSLVGIYLIQNNRLVYVNPALAEMFSYHPDEIIDKLDAADLFIPAYRLVIAENLRRRLTGVIDKHPYRLTGLRKDGTTFECEVLGRRVDYQGAPAIMGTLLDVTERQQVEQKTIALAVEQEKTALLRNFVTAISHEFRNPLAIINTKMYLLSKVTELSARDMHIAVVQEQVARLNRMVNNLLALIKFENRATSERQPVSLNALMGELVGYAESRVEARNQTLHVEMSESPLTVTAVEEDLYEALRQLVDNALQYTPNGGTITIKTSLEAEQVVIVVQDTGIGIPEEDLPHIFEVMYRADKARPIENTGTGLGLTIAHQIITAHQGKITVDSTPDTGTTFTVYLPAATDQLLAPTG